MLYEYETLARGKHHILILYVKINLIFSCHQNMDMESEGGGFRWIIRMKSNNEKNHANTVFHSKKSNSFFIFLYFFF